MFKILEHLQILSHMNKNINSYQVGDKSLNFCLNLPLFLFITCMQAAKTAPISRLIIAACQCNKCQNLMNLLIDIILTFASVFTFQKVSHNPW